MYILMLFLKLKNHYQIVSNIEGRKSKTRFPVSYRYGFSYLKKLFG